MLKPPLLWPAITTSKEEAAAIKDLYANLCAVVFNLEAWKAALELYEFSKTGAPGVSRDMLRKWGFIASHECVMQIYFLKERLKVIKGHKIRTCPTIEGDVDDTKTKVAATLLDKHFPRIDTLRDAIAHEGSIGTNPAKHAPEGSFGLVGFHKVDTFSAPYKKTYVELELTSETTLKLTGVVTMFLEAFEPAARKLEQLGHAD